MDPYVVYTTLNGAESYAVEDINGPFVDDIMDAHLFTFAAAVRCIEALRSYGGRCEMRRVSRILRATVK